MRRVSVPICIAKIYLKDKHLWTQYLILYIYHMLFLSYGGWVCYCVHTHYILMICFDCIIGFYIPLFNVIAFIRTYE